MTNRKRRTPAESREWFAERLRVYTAAVRDAYAASGDLSVTPREFQRRADLALRIQDELIAFVSEAMYLAPGDALFPFLSPIAAPVESRRDGRRA